MESTPWDTATVILGGICTLAIFSFLIRENPFYRFFEHLFIGIAAGFLPIFTIKDFLWPRVLAPMSGFTTVQYPDGTYAEPYQPLYLLYIAPMLFGLLYYFLYSRKYSWLAKVVIGFSLGYSAGLTFKGFFAEMLPQLTSSFKPLIVLGEGGIDWTSSANNCFFVVTLFSVMYYFFFSFRRDSGSSKAVSNTGRMLMMICFGAFFGSTVMARMALLVERMHFLLVEWANAIVSCFQRLVQ